MKCQLPITGLPKTLPKSVQRDTIGTISLLQSAFEHLAITGNISTKPSVPTGLVAGEVHVQQIRAQLCISAEIW